nr:hypothetical protein ISGA_5139 [Gordonia sp. NB41Y]
MDAHVHLWDRANPWYPGLAAMAADLGDPDMFPTFLLEDYRRDGATAGVDGFVHVSAVTAPQAHHDELRWVADLADRAGVDMRFVGTVDPQGSSSEIIADLDAQLAITGRLSGIRVLYDFPPESAAAQTVLRWLEEHGLVFDLVTHPGDMDAWIRTISAFDGLTTVLEHTGWPDGTDPAAHACWRTAVTTCARETAARCKLSGLGMVTGELSAEALRPWLEPALEAFGWDRVIFGSNIPIEHMAGTHTDLQHALDTVLGAGAPGDLQRFYADNAITTYGFEEER